MKTLVAVVAIFLLILGASVVYYRSDWGLPKAGPAPAGRGKVAGSSAVEPIKFTALEIRQDGDLKIGLGKSVLFNALARDDVGALMTISVDWSLSDSALGKLSLPVASEVKFTGGKVGKGKIKARYSLQNLTAEKEIEVVGKVLGQAAPVVTTAPAGNVGVATTTPPAVPFEIRLFDPSGARFNVGESRTLTSQVQYTDNSIKTPDLEWSVSPSDLASLDRSKGSSINLKALKSGSGLIKATLGNLSARLYLLIN